MATEIPPIEVITAVADTDLENYISELLFSQGWSIIYRALDASQLLHVLSSRTHTRTVLLYTSQIPGFSSDLLLYQSELNFTAISLDGITRKDPHQIMSTIRAYFQTPTPPREVRPEQPHVEERRRERIITVTGSSNSPGRTLFATAIAEELSLSKNVALVDADMRNRSITRDQRRVRYSCEVASLKPEERPMRLPEIGRGDVAIVDIGQLPPLHDLPNDRRWQAALIQNCLQSTTHLVYICKSTMASIDELQEFIGDFPDQLRSVPISFICIASTGKRDSRSSLDKFDAILGSARRAVLPMRQLVDSSFTIPLLQTPTRSKREIAKIALSLL